MMFSVCFGFGFSCWCWSVPFVVFMLFLSLSCSFLYSNAFAHSRTNPYQWEIRSRREDKRNVCISELDKRAKKKRILFVILSGIYFDSVALRVIITNAIPFDVRFLFGWCLFHLWSFGDIFSGVVSFNNVFNSAIFFDLAYDLIFVSRMFGNVVFFALLAFFSVASLNWCCCKWGHYISIESVTDTFPWGGMIVFCSPLGVG